jgi:hypothetical protein
MTKNVEQGKIDFGYCIDVLEECGRRVASVRFGDAITITQSGQPI